MVTPQKKPIQMEDSQLLDAIQKIQKDYPAPGAPEPSEFSAFGVFGATLQGLGTLATHRKIESMVPPTVPHMESHLRKVIEDAGRVQPKGAIKILRLIQDKLNAISNAALANDKAAIDVPASPAADPPKPAAAAPAG